jgi:membrane fusion protein (multidrug efflux system)
MAEPLTTHDKPVGNTSDSLPPVVKIVAASQPVAPTRISRRTIAFRTVAASVVLLLLCLAGYWLFPAITTALNTVSTDDAYVEGHVTFVAPRVSGQVAQVLVDDNMRVKRGDVLVRLDKEPYQVEVAIKQAAVVAAEADLAQAHAHIRGVAAQARSNRYNLEHAIENVRNQVALIKANVAQLNVEKANLDLAERDFNRNKPLVERGAIPQSAFDQFTANLNVAKNKVTNAQEAIDQTRANLGLPPNRENPLDIPSDLEQNFSLVRQTLSAVLQSVAELGFVPSSYNITPQQAIAEFYRQDPQGNLDKIYEHLVVSAPAIKQAQAKLLEARRDLDQAELNLRYTDVVSEIDGQVTRRNVNPGNNVQAGQSLMAVRSLTEIWINANFKETQLADLRIGQRVVLKADMYGHRHEFEGRITGFTMGTGQTLALLPPQNATGNFVKIVQRLPVRIDLTHYDPDKQPLFVGLSVEPHVYFKEPAMGEGAGKFLQDIAQLPGAPVPGTASTPTATQSSDQHTVQKVIYSTER